MSLFGPPDVRALREEGDIKGLIGALKYQKNPDVAHEAVQALGVLVSSGIRDSRAVEALMDILTGDGHGDQTLQHLAVQWLGSMGDPRAIEVLIPALAGNPNTRCVAATSLGRMAEEGIRDRRSIAPLVSALDDTDPGVRICAAQALEQLGWQPERTRAA